MRKILIVIGALLGGLVAFAFWTGIISIGATGGVCRRDGEIDASKRASVERTAMDFAKAVLGPNAKSAFDMMTKQAQDTSSPEKLVAMMAGAASSMGTLGSLKPVHTYFLNVSGAGPDTRVICGMVGGTDWVSVSARPGLSQAHVELEGRSRNNNWAFDLWLLPDGENWRVQYFHIGASAMVGYTPDTLLALARRERDAGHAFNAAMLYAGTQFISDRGPAFQLGSVQALRDDLGRFQQPPELQSQSHSLPIWNLGGAAYHVGHVTILGVDGQLALVFDLPQQTWPGDHAISDSNQAFLTAFIAAHKDYGRVFGFLVARADKPDNSGSYGTVYRRDGGFMPPKF